MPRPQGNGRIPRVFRRQEGLWDKGKKRHEKPARKEKTRSRAPKPVFTLPITAARRSPAPWNYRCCTEVCKGALSDVSYRELKIGPHLFSAVASPSCVLGSNLPVIRHQLQIRRCRFGTLSGIPRRVLAVSGSPWSFPSTLVSISGRCQE